MSRPKDKDETNPRSFTRMIYIPMSLMPHGYRGDRALHSFPTRRSSDLAGELRRHGVEADLAPVRLVEDRQAGLGDRKSTRLNSSHLGISYAVFCSKKNTSDWARSASG